MVLLFKRHTYGKIVFPEIIRKVVIDLFDHLGMVESVMSLACVGMGSV